MLDRLFGFLIAEDVGPCSAFPVFCDSGHEKKYSCSFVVIDQ